MKQRFLVVLAVLPVVASIYGVISWYIAFQATTAERKPLEDSLARLELPFEDVVFPARDDSAILHGWYLPTENAYGAIILVHGLDSNRASPDIGLVDLAAGLYWNGFSVLSFDLRGHGESGGGRLSGGHFEQEDVLGAYDWLIEQGLSPGKVGLWGISLGADIALLASVRESGIVAVVADSPFADIRDMIASEIPKRTSAPTWLAPIFIPGGTVAAHMFYGIDLNLIVPENTVGNLDYPIFLIHCAEDERISSEHSKRIHKAAPSSILWIASCGEHAKAFKTLAEEYLQQVSDYFRQRFSINTPVSEDASLLYQRHLTVQSKASSQS